VAHREAIAASGSNGNERELNAEPEADPDLVAAAVAVIPNSARLKLLRGIELNENESEDGELDWENWNYICMATYRGTGGRGFAIVDEFSQRSPKYNPKATIERWHELSRCPPSQVGARSLFWLANKARPGWDGAYYAKIEEEFTAAAQRERAERAKMNGGGQQQWHDEGEQQTKSEQQQRAKHEQTKDDWRAALPLINISNWDSEPVPQQEWAVPDRIPMKKVTLFSGEGGGGKSLIQLQLSVAHVLGRDWLGVTPRQGSALFIDAEDDEPIIHKRLADILRHYGAKFADVAKDLHLVSLAGENAVLGVYDRNVGKIMLTILYKRLLEMAGDLRPTMIGIASSADVFAGSEIDRPQVQQFIALLTKVAMTAHGALTLISHPSLTGISTDTGLSGSTQWSNSVRARFYLKSTKATSEDAPDTNLREIVFKKNNYGPISANIVLEYRNGLFLPVETEFDVAVKGERAKNVFLALLTRFNAQNRNVSANNGPGYAPKTFAEEPEALAARLTKNDLARAMRVLLKSGEIAQEPYGKTSNQHHRLVVCPPHDERPM
jgi:RecA-family ATPase